MKSPINRLIERFPQSRPLPSKVRIIGVYLSISIFGMGLSERKMRAAEGALGGGGGKAALPVQGRHRLLLLRVDFLSIAITGRSSGSHLECERNYRSNYWEWS